MPRRFGFRAGKSLHWLDAASGAGFVALAVWLLLPLSLTVSLLTTATRLLSAGTKGRTSAEGSLGEDLDGELRSLTELWEGRLIGDREYERRRVEIMRPQW